MAVLRALTDIVQAWDAWVASGCDVDTYRILTIRIQAARAVAASEDSREARMLRRRLPVQLPGGTIRR